MNILNQILRNKKREVFKQKKIKPLGLLKKEAGKVKRPVLYLKKTSRLRLIAEIKPKSPSAGVIRANADPLKIAREFTLKGAAAISVLTDEKYFGGSLKMFSAVRGVSRLPLLRKEFIIDPYQVYETKVCGANIILLIASALKRRIAKFTDLALSLGLQPLIEVRNSAEVKAVLKLIKPNKQIIIGINNRDLKTFQIDLRTSINLVKLIPKKFIRISESGIFNSLQLEMLRAAGFDGVLIGSGLVKNSKLFNYFL